MSLLYLTFSRYALKRNLGVYSEYHFTLTNLSAHKNCDKSVLHSNLEEIFNDWRSNETSKKFTRNTKTYTREKIPEKQDILVEGKKQSLNFLKR